MTDNMFQMSVDVTFTGGESHMVEVDRELEKSRLRPGRRFTFGSVTIPIDQLEDKVDLLQDTRPLQYATTDYAQLYANSVIEKARFVSPVKSGKLKASLTYTLNSDGTMDFYSPLPYWSKQENITHYRALQFTSVSNRDYVNRRGILNVSTYDFIDSYANGITQYLANSIR